MQKNAIVFFNNLKIVYITPFVHKSDVQNTVAFFTFLLDCMKKKGSVPYYGAKGMGTSRMKLFVSSYIYKYSVSPYLQPY